MRRNLVDYTLGRNNIEQEEKKPKRLTRAKRGFITLSAVGVGTFVLGHMVGTKYGYRRGFDNGILHTVNHFAEGMEIITKNAKESKGE